MLLLATSVLFTVSFATRLEAGADYQRTSMPDTLMFRGFQWLIDTQSMTHPKTYFNYKFGSNIYFRHACEGMTKLAGSKVLE